MKLKPIVDQIKARMPIIGGRATGAAAFAPLQASAQIALPLAVVIGAPETIEQPDRHSGNLRTTFVQQFEVVGVFSNETDSGGDERGQAAWDQAEDFRAELVGALAGWEASTDLDLVEYTGGMDVIHIDRARTYITFGFQARGELGHADTFQGTAHDELPDLEDVEIKLDVMEPIADKNVQYPGPDGRTEFQADHTGLDQ